MLPPPRISILQEPSSCWHTVVLSSVWHARSGATHGSATTALSVRQQPSTPPCNGTAESQTPGSPPLRRTPAPRGHLQTLRPPQGRSQPSPPLRHAYDGTGASATVQYAALPTSASCARAHPIVPRIALFCNPIQPLARLTSLLGQTRTSSSNLLHSQAGDWPASASNTHS